MATRKQQTPPAQLPPANKNGGNGNGQHRTTPETPQQQSQEKKKRGRVPGAPAPMTYNDVVIMVLSTQKIDSVKKLHKSGKAFKREILDKAAEKLKTLPGQKDMARELEEFILDTFGEPSQGRKAPEVGDIKVYKAQCPTYKRTTTNDKGEKVPVLDDKGEPAIFHSAPQAVIPLETLLGDYQQAAGKRIAVKFEQNRIIITAADENAKTDD